MTINSLIKTINKSSFKEEIRSVLITFCERIKSEDLFINLINNISQYIDQNIEKFELVNDESAINLYHDRNIITFQKKKTNSDTENQENVLKDTSLIYFLLNWTYPNNTFIYLDQYKKLFLLLTSNDISNLIQIIMNNLYNFLDLFYYLLDVTVGVPRETNLNEYIDIYDKPYINNLLPNINLIKIKNFNSNDIKLIIIDIFQSDNQEIKQKYIDNILTPQEDGQELFNYIRILVNERQNTVNMIVYELCIENLNNLIADTIINPIKEDYIRFMALDNQTREYIREIRQKSDNIYKNFLIKLINTIKELNLIDDNQKIKFDKLIDFLENNIPYPDEAIEKIKIPTFETSFNHPGLSDSPNNLRSKKYLNKINIYYQSNSYKTNSQFGGYQLSKRFQFLRFLLSLATTGSTACLSFCVGLFLDLEQTKFRGFLRLTPEVENLIINNAKLILNRLSKSENIPNNNNFFDQESKSIKENDIKEKLDNTDSFILENTSNIPKGINNLDKDVRQELYNKLEKLIIKNNIRELLEFKLLGTNPIQELISPGLLNQSITIDNDNTGKIDNLYKEENISKDKLFEKDIVAIFETNKTLSVYKEILNQLSFLIEEFNKNLNDQFFLPFINVPYALVSSLAYCIVIFLQTIFNFIVRPLSIILIPLFYISVFPAWFFYSFIFDLFIYNNMSVTTVFPLIQLFLYQPISFLLQPLSFIITIISNFIGYSLNIIYDTIIINLVNFVRPLITYSLENKLITKPNSNTSALSLFAYVLSEKIFFTSQNFITFRIINPTISIRFIYLKQIQIKLESNQEKLEQKYSNFLSKFTDDFKIKILDYLEEIPETHLNFDNLKVKLTNNDFSNILSSNAIEDAIEQKNIIRELVEIFETIFKNDKINLDRNNMDPKDKESFDKEIDTLERLFGENYISPEEIDDHVREFNVSKNLNINQFIRVKADFARKYTKNILNLDNANNSNGGTISGLNIETEVLTIWRNAYNYYKDKILPDYIYGS